MRRLFLVALTLAPIFLSQPSARAVPLQANASNIPYVIGFSPLNSRSFPCLGQLTLNVNDGIISGRYTDHSIQPSCPLRNAHMVGVSGGVRDNGSMWLLIRGITFRGTSTGTQMSGSANIRGRIFAFEAQQGTLR